MTRAWARISARVAACTLAGALAGCGKVQGFGGAAPPLVTFNFSVTGDLTPLLPSGETGPRSLQVALVWGAQWQQEPFCFLPPDPRDDAAKIAAVVTAGCRDPFAFTPALVAGNTPVTVGTPATMSLFSLPSAEVMVTSGTGRIAYGTFVVYDDRDGSGTLELATPRRTRSGGPQGPPMPDLVDSPDIVYGASFVTMTAPDERVAYLEGTYLISGFYPRNGCNDPPGSFSIVGAGGFSVADAIAASAKGQLPVESSCIDPVPGQPLDRQVSIAVQDHRSVQEVSCVQRATDSSVRYREPPPDAPDFFGRTTACAHLPTFDAQNQSSLIQLVVSGRRTDRCLGLTHYTLRGCRENVACPVPDWDFTATPPAWWPCRN
ncbi:MAG TPA: hypothetical protein VFH68_11165 [Polyangia bacterium]|nr:hypothetical protein [Polyangia bacterium]